MAGGLCAARAVVVALVGAVWARAEQAVVFDAGSTGTRVHVITYAPAPHADMPAITHLASSKVEPGLSAFARSPDDAAATIAPLLRFAERHVAEGARTRTPLMLYGTAGMRLLSNADQRRVYASALRACEASAFSIVRSSFTTLSGSDEGFFGLLALMWLQVTATATVARPTAGILDLGGGSTQIAFPTTAEAAAAAAGEPSAGGADAAEREVRVGGADVPVFSRSHLGFGNRAALRRVEELLVERARERGALEPARAAEAPTRATDSADSVAGRMMVEHPCFHRGYSYASARALFVGTANQLECTQLVACLFECASAPCSRLGARAHERLRASARRRARSRRRQLLPLPLPLAPALPAAASTACTRMPPFVRGVAPPAGMRFFGLSAMFYIVNYLAFKQRLRDVRTPSIAELRDATAAVCALPWAAIRSAARDVFTPEHKLPQRCFDAHYMLALLVRGFGFGESSRQIVFAEKVGAGQPEWPYGAALHFILRANDRGGAHARAPSARTLAALVAALVGAGACWRWRRARAAGYAGVRSGAPIRLCRRKHSGTNSDASESDEPACAEVGADGQLVGMESRGGMRSAV
ncbi:hypothetical protein KFE25_011705 [Diacronema lutheri]|uniref:Apyrase n=1 Tax=Diacronema lutheri TaxID=2081491 RepID=A0A8J5X5C4_DIALT|nr:hypothetical protein KFE25_011705 [Diacronema lutheri]